MNIPFLNNNHVSPSNIRALLSVRGFILAVIFISSALITLLPDEYLTGHLAISAALVLACWDVGNRDRLRTACSINILLFRNDWFGFRSRSSFFRFLF